jgi:hypothetical protein
MDTPAQAPAALSKDDLLNDLLGGSLAPAQPAPQPVATPGAKPVAKPVVTPVAPPVNPPGVQIFHSGDLQIYFEVQKKGVNPNMIAIRASAYRLTACSLNTQ